MISNRLDPDPHNPGDVVRVAGRPSLRRSDTRLAEGE